jgi:hypothetical protein
MKLSTGIELEGNDIHFCQWIYISHNNHTFLFIIMEKPNQERIQNFKMCTHCGFVEVSITNV